ncbi:MAG TPA: hypothetical protein VF944_00850, partial [Candidatus Bathyarchaeia archaeon]
LRQQLANLTDMRVRELLSDEEYLARRREIDVTIVAAKERLKKQEFSSDWFEPARLLLAFGEQALFWFSQGTDDIKRSIVAAIGSNYTLTDEKLDGEAEKPFSLQAEQPQFLYGWAFLRYIRTQFESKDPLFLKLIDNVRKVKAMVEEGMSRGTFPASQGELHVSERLPSKDALAIRELSPPYKPRPRRKVYRSTLYFRHRSSRKKSDQIQGGVGGS